MTKLNYRDGLLYTNISVSYVPKTAIVEDVIVDTGAYHTIIEAEYLRELNLEISPDDQLIKCTGYGGATSSAVRKEIDLLELGDIALNQVKIDFGMIDPHEKVNGLIGLDFLVKAGLIIDLVDLTIYQKPGDF